MSQALQQYQELKGRLGKLQQQESFLKGQQEEATRKTNELLATLRAQGFEVNSLEEAKKILGDRFAAGLAELEKSVADTETKYASLRS